jgi:transcriptional antiterminator NusG
MDQDNKKQLNTDDTTSEEQNEKVNEEENQDVVKDTENEKVEEETEENKNEDTETEDIEDNIEEEIDEDKKETEEDEKDQDMNDADDDNIVVINSNVLPEANWYVVHTYSGHENKVALSLKERVEAAGHTDKVFKIFLPHQQKIVVSEGKKRSVDEKLFPGYLVVLMIMSDDSWYIVRSTPGVTGFVGMGSTPTPLPESEVQTLMKFAKMDAPKFEAKFRVGDSVKVNDGPFKDFLGKVDEVNEEQGKVKVLVSVFGRETPLELAFTQVSQL